MGFFFTIYRVQNNLTELTANQILKKEHHKICFVRTLLSGI